MNNYIQTHYYFKSLFTFANDFFLTTFFGLMSFIFKLGEEFKLCKLAVASLICRPPEVIALPVPALFILFAVESLYSLEAVPVLPVAGRTTPDIGLPALLEGLIIGLLPFPADVPTLCIDVPGLATLDIACSSRSIPLIASSS
jgi:hypothetical protein